ncbi:hypothetical protein SDC9_199101 [bioreactor metagenome]|uniref:Uncharacterized protein n=1 Tax=bioreactor metagenome TaxID=1076179 RepID=A0A645IJJ2_9ZZZZ
MTYLRVKDFSLLGELQRRDLTIEQFNPDRVFQGANTTAEGGLRDITNNRGLGEVSALFQRQKVIKPFRFNVIQTCTTHIHLSSPVSRLSAPFYGHSHG